MTDQDWKTVEGSLMWGVDLLIDGYRVRLRRVRTSESTYEIFVYVNGEFRGEWIAEDCEERRRFLRPSVQHVYKPKFRNEMKKRLGKRYLAKLDLDLDQKITIFTPLWPSFRPLKRHLIAHNKNIELCKEPTP